jgi:hypothetical protein
VGLRDGQRLVAQGGLTTGILHALVAMDMPGPGTEVHPTKPVSRLRMKVTRQNGETVLEGEAWCYRFAVDDPRG